MKAISIVHALVVAAAATLLAGCAAGGSSSTSNSGASTVTKSKRLENEKTGVTAEKLKQSKAFADFSHCRIGHRFKDNQSIALLWWIKKAELMDFVTSQDMNFEIIDANFNEGVSPPFKIDKFDTLTGVLETSDSVKITYTNLSGQTDKNFSAILKLDASKLWVEGPAILDDGTVSGKIVMFALPETGMCEHSYYSSHPPHPICRVVVIEHFHKGDANAWHDFPVFGKNIFDKDDPRCLESGTSEETSDGEGHEGPR